MRVFRPDLLTALATTFLLLSQSVSAQEPSALQALSAQLHAALDSRIAETRKAPENRFREDISPVVTRYLPNGITIGQAEAVLKGAGLAVTRKPPPGPWPANTPLPVLSAERDDKVFLGSFSVQISVFASASPGRRNQIGKVYAILRTNIS